MPVDEAVLVLGAFDMILGSAGIDEDVRAFATRAADRVRRHLSAAIEADSILP